MKIGLISDIHSNAPALKEVLNYLEDAGIDRIVHAGDVIGYNPFPNEVIRMLMDKKVEGIRGNHEIIYLTGDTSRAYEPAEMAIEWTKKVLASNSSDYISRLDDSMTFQVEGVRVAVYHGSPSSPWKYTHENGAKSDLLKEADADILVLGHTHIPYVKRLRQGLIVNPGSVGQPRDRDWRTSFAILEIEKMNAKIVRLPYDVESVISKIHEVGLPATLADRLKPRS